MPELDTLFDATLARDGATFGLATQAQATVLGRASGAGTGQPTALSAAQLATVLTAQNLLPKTLRIPLFDAGNSGASKTIDWTDSNEQLLTLTDNVTLTLSNPGDGGRYVLILLQDPGGGNDVTWPSSVKWPGGAAPTITATGDAYDLVTLIYLSGAGIYLASINQNYSA